MPIDLETFLYAEDYLHMPKLSAEQFRVLRELDDDNPDTNKILEAVLVWGKGGGKDWISAIFISRRVYKLLCRANPQAFYRLPQGEPIDILNVAVSAEQANSVFFTKLTNIIKHAGKKTFIEFGFDPIKDIKANKIVFPKEIRVFSGHSEQESMEGKNLFAAIMDEAAAFKTESELKGKGPRAKRSAKALYDSLSSSIRSRFPKVGKLVIISYPRFTNDFILQRYDACKNKPDALISFGSTWDINPLVKREDFIKDYRDNPEQSKSMYECVPPKAKEPFIREQEKVDLIIDRTVRTPYDMWGQYFPEFRGKPFSYSIGIDLSLTGDSTGFALLHKEKRQDKDIVVIDLLKKWTAEPGREIDLEEIRREIIFLRARGFNITSILFDQFQCLTGDTKISLLDGNDAKIKDLVGKQDFYVYSIDKENKKIVAGKVIKVWSNGFKKIIKITLDNGEEIKCTNSHPFMLRDGNYKEASNLVIGESLMPLYKKHSQKGYEITYNPFSNSWKKTYKRIVVKNHKIVKIENCGYEEAYDMEIEKYHNFALSAGIFVHNSAHMIQELKKQGFNVDTQSIERNLDIWNSVKALIYNGELKIYDSEISYELIEELKGLSLIAGNRVDHVGDFSAKDLSDAVVRAVHGLVQTQGNDFSWKVM